MAGRTDRRQDLAADIDRKRWSEGIVEEVRHWTRTLHSLRVRADIEPFVAGQFTKLGLTIGDEFVTRPYSYVNAPHETTLEFYFVTVPDGPLTKRLKNMSAGQAVEVMRRAAGFLTLDELPEAPHLWLLATGTGIGPFLSILKTSQAWQRFEQIVLVHAVRLATELSYPDTVARLQQEYPERFHYVPVVSREDTDLALRGRVPALIEGGLLEQRAGLGFASELSQVMLCGNPEMVKATVATLEGRGLARNRRRSPGQISVENYW
jgi:ferredoxin--NADP+ reductase